MVASGAPGGSGSTTAKWMTDSIDWAVNNAGTGAWAKMDGKKVRLCFLFHASRKNSLCKFSVEKQLCRTQTFYGDLATRYFFFFLKDLLLTSFRVARSQRQDSPAVASRPTCKRKTPVSLPSVSSTLANSALRIPTRSFHPSGSQFSTFWAALPILPTKT